MTDKTFTSEELFETWKKNPSIRVALKEEPTKERCITSVSMVKKECGKDSMIFHLDDPKTITSGSVYASDVMMYEDDLLEIKKKLIAHLSYRFLKMDNILPISLRVLMAKEIFSNGDYPAMLIYSVLGWLHSKDHDINVAVLNWLELHDLIKKIPYNKYEPTGLSK